MNDAMKLDELIQSLNKIREIRGGDTLVKTSIVKNNDDGSFTYTQGFLVDIRVYSESVTLCSDWLPNSKLQTRIDTHE